MAVFKDTNGTYFIQVSYRDNAGNVKSKKKRGFRTKREAINYEVTLRTQINPSADASMTYGNLFEAYLQKNAATANNETITEKRALAKNFWGSLFDLKVKDIKSRDYLQIWNAITATDYARLYKNKVIAILKSVSRFGNIYYDFPDSAKSLNLLQKTTEDVKDFKVWTPQQFALFIQHVESPIMSAYFTFLFRTGTRRSEALGLLKSDIHGNKVTINKSIKHFKNGPLPLKNASSVRTISMDSELLTLLQPLLQREGKYLFGDHATLAISTIQREFKRAIQASGVPEIRIHDLRHSHASFLISKNVNIVAVSKRLGHEDINTTLSIYTHLMKESEDYLLEIMENSKL
jgi:integrase